MHIEHINVTAFLGITRAEVARDAPVTVIAGENASGKSSLAEAVRFALLGQPRRVSRKKDYPSLVTAGHKKGHIQVTYTDQGGEHVSGITLPDGKHTEGSQPPQHDSLDICLGEQRFIALREHERRQLLMRATGVRAKKDDVEKRMKRRGIRADVIECVTPLLRSGFDAAASTAAGHAQSKEREWEHTTGEKYGHVKADGWKAEGVTPPKANDVKQARSALTKACKAARADLDSLIAEQSELIDAAKAAMQAQHHGTDHACPECGARLVLEDGELRAWTEDEEAPDSDASPVQFNDPAAAVQTHTRAHDELQRIRGAIEGINDETAQPDESIAAQLGQEWLDDLAAKAGHLSQLREQEQASQNAQAVTEAATKRHDDAQQFRLAEAALKPDGIPAELLREAIRPVNERLEQSCKAASWPSIQIDDDCDVRVGDRLYALCSESEQWRADLVVAEALAYQTGLRIFMSDRVDVLDLPNRARLMAWLGTIVGDYDTVLLLGTFKKAPENLPEGIRAYWLEDGRIDTTQAQEAA